MTGEALNISIAGQDAEAAAAEVSRIFSQEFNMPISRQGHNTPQSAQQTKSVDWVAIAAIILALPGAALATKDLTDRFTKQKKLEETLTKIKKVVKTRKVRIKVILKNGTVKEIEKVTTTEILDQFSPPGS